MWVKGGSDLPVVLWLSVSYAQGWVQVALAGV